MENTNKTIAQLLEITEFPFILETKTEKGKVIYKEFKDNKWNKYELNLNNNLIYEEESNGYWKKYEYDLDNNLISKFNNNVESAKYLNISKVTVGKSLKSGLIYNKIYRFKPIQD